MNLNATCKRKPCSFNGVYQPQINYNAQDFYGFSEFWYTMQGLKMNKFEFEIFDFVFLELRCFQFVFVMFEYIQELAPDLFKNQMSKTESKKKKIFNFTW